MKSLCCFFLTLGISTTGITQNLEKQFDQILNEEFSPEEPGATAIVVVKGEIVYHKAFGMANLELDVKMKPEMVFEIASITKQFTAVSILMLVEQGKLKLDDNITKFIADYPNHGHHISIHHLLTHTSGIKNYTDMASWPSIWRKDFEPMAFIDFFKDAPMDCAPGEAYNYSNSAYHILGVIIEKASGLTYKKFIETNIFEPIGMNSSYYGTTSKIIKNRASGYQKEENYINPEYLSSTQKYSAGAIMSTVKDLFIWNSSIRSNKLLKKGTIELAFANYQLNNGEKINYGYGWGINEINGSPTVEHNGSVFGFSTNSIYLPNEDVFIAVFTNCDSYVPDAFTPKIAAIAMGKPYPDIKEKITIDTERLKKFVGVYDFADSSSRVITIEGNQLYSQRESGGKYKIIPTTMNTFFYDFGTATIEFQENGDEIKATFSHRINVTTGIKTDKPIPIHNEIELDLEILELYTGDYEINSGLKITFSIEDEKLMAKATGQPKFEMSAESQTKFILKPVGAKVEFIESEDGKFKSFILFQEGQKVIGKKKN
jgi:CubicO group peptidase (beta-lactamase class C family)